MLARLTKLCLPPEIDAAGWRRACRIMALGGALLAALLDFLPDVWSRGWHWSELLQSLGVYLLVWALLQLAFRASQQLFLQLGQRMAQGLERAQLGGAVQELPNQGWAVFERGRTALIRLLEDRDEQIARLSRELEFYRPLAEDMPGLELFFGVDGRLAWINPAVQALTGYSVADCLAAGDPAELWVYVKDRPTMRDMMARALQGEARDGQELRIQHLDGRVLWYACRWYPLRDAQGKLIGTRFSAQDVQARKDAELKLLETVAALRRAQALKEHYLGRSNDERMRLSALLDIVQLGILFVDHDHRVVYINQSCADMWQLGERSAVVGVRDETLLARTSALRVDNDAYLLHVDEVVSQRREGAEYDIYCSDGRVVRERSSVVPSSDGGKPIGRVWIYEDITATLQTQARLTELAERDPLTGLYNRRRFHEDLERLLAETNRRGEALGLLMFDVDNFKDINDRLGHQAGDEALLSLSGELRQVIRRNELLFRLGGDEFAILVAQPNPESLAQLARRVLLRAEALSFIHAGQPLSLTISLGAAIAPQHGHDGESLVLAADRALYQAKAEGRNCWRMAFRWPGEESASAPFSSVSETLQ